jgi:protein NrfD
MNFTNLEAWDVRVTLDLFFGGIGVGAFLLSVLLSFYKKNSLRLRIKIGAYLAPVMVGLGLLLLIAKLGVPTKFITTLWNVNIQSVMSVGAFLQTGFVFLALIYAFLIWKDAPIDNKFRLVQTFGSFFAFGTGVYHGLFLSSIGRVLWTELTPGMFFASSLTSGIAFVLLLELAVNHFKKTKDEPELDTNATPLGLYRYPVMFFVVLLVQFVSVVLWQFYTGRLELEQALSYDYFMQQYSIAWTYIVLVGGILIPMLISVVSMVKQESKFSQSLAIVVGVLILIGGFVMKHLMVTGGQISLPVGFTF